VVNCWNKYVPRERVRRVAGASAGSLIAAYYLMDLPLDECLAKVVEMTEDIRKRPLGVFDRSNQIVDILPRVLDEIFPEDAHKRVNGRLYVCMTRLRDMKAVVVNEFESKRDLIDALNCSCFIPVWSGNHVSTFRGVKHIDGGFKNNLPAFDEHTIRVCCFAGPSDIAPYDPHSQLLQTSVAGMPVYLTWRNLGRLKRALWPPPASYIMQLLEQGFHDTKAFILSNDLIQCHQCFGQLEHDHQPIYSRLKNPTISPACTPAVSRSPSFRQLAGLLPLGTETGTHKPEAEVPPVGAPSEYLGSAGGEKRQEDATAQRRARLSSGSSAEGGSLGSCESAADSTTSSGVFSNEEPPTGSSTGGSQQAKGRSLGSLLRTRLGALARSQKRQSSGEGGPMGAGSGAPAIVLETPDEGERRCAEELLAAECLELGGGSGGGSAKEEEPAEKQPHLDEADSSWSEESLVQSARIKLRRGSRSKPLVSCGPSPMDKFVRRMSSTPVQETSANEQAEQENCAQDKERPADQEQQQQQAGLLGANRFAMAPSPLPSCPPSPNLNRHCGECSRMRQQARLDELDEQIKKQAELYRNLSSEPDPEKEFASLIEGTGFRSKVGRFFRKITGKKSKNEYDFHELFDQPREIPSLS